MSCLIRLRYERRLNSKRTLLMHGDTLCTDDLDYQRFRDTVRAPEWQRIFLAKPLAERRAIALGLRAQSEEAKGSKDMTLMDVNPHAVAKTFQDSGVTRIVHGHTHRPARHELRVGQQLCERWVLSDWHETAPYLLCDSDGLRALEM